MSERINVVKGAYVKEEAYRMGYNRFDEMPVEDADTWHFDPFTDSAEWCNTILPRLRSMAGYNDRGHGTYKETSRVALIVPGCEEDEPAEADLVNSRAIFETLTENYRVGAYDAVHGREADPDRATI